MATRTNKVEVEIVASDEATPTIERLEKKIDGLEADEARITVTANTDRLQRQLDDARTKLQGLDGDEATVQGRLVGNLEQSLDQAETLLRQLDGKTGTVRINAVDTASGDLDRVEQKLRDVDGRVARIGTTGEKAGGTSAIGAAGKAVGVAAIAAALFDAVDSAHQLGNDVQLVAQQTGAPIDQASRLVAIWQQNGLEVADLLDILFQVNGALQQNPELAEQLGINLAENQSLIDTFLQAVEGVGTKFEDVADRQVAASQLFGEEGVRQVGSVQRAVGDLDTAMSELPDARVLDEQEIAKLQDANDELVEFKGHLSEIQLLLATTIIPLVNDMLGGIAAYFTAVGNAGEATGNWFRHHRRASGTEILNAFGLASNTAGLTEQDIIARNIAGQGGYGAMLTGDLYGSAPRGRASRGANVTIVNPPGTPPATADQLRLYDERNGPR